MSHHLVRAPIPPGPGAVLASLAAMTGLVDYGRAAVVYEQGRALTAEDLHRWEMTVSRFVDPHRTAVLDLGAGTGIFTRGWSSWGARGVIACEPSPAMRREAMRAGWPRDAVLVAGRAEQIPLVAAATDVILRRLPTSRSHLRGRYARCA